MADHYCEEHQVKFFKKGGMKGYAHPLEDGAGETIGWCNEEKPSEPKPDPPKEAVKQSSTNASIEAQVAFKGYIKLIEAGVLLDNSKEYQTTLNWANSKLANWASAGEPPKSKPKTEPMITDMQKVQLEAMSKERGYEPKLVIEIMIHEFQIGYSKELTEKQAVKLLKILESKKYIDGVNPEEPEDITF